MERNTNANKNPVGKTDNTYYYCNSVERDEIIEHVARALIQPVATNDRFNWYIIVQGSM